MTIATTDVHFSIQETIDAWAGAQEPVKAVRAAEGADPKSWHQHWSHLCDLGVFGVAVPESCGGLGAEFVDLAVMLEQLSYHLAPGSILTTSLAGIAISREGGEVADIFLGSVIAGERSCGIGWGGHVHADAGVAQAVSGDAGYVLGATGEPSSVILIPVACEQGRKWALVDAAHPSVQLETADPVDFSRALARVSFNNTPVYFFDNLRTELVDDLLVTLLAAEAVGVLRWCLDTAVAYAKTREQFGAKIGTFQAIKHLCAQLLCRVEQSSAAAWDAASAVTDEFSGVQSQLPIAAAVAASTAFTAAVEAAKDCIQILGGIGFTWEHDAHLYLRRALALKHFAGSGSNWHSKVADLTLAGTRRKLGVDLLSVEPLRAQVHSKVTAIADLPAEEQRVALAESGYLAPHWPLPYGLAASAAHQLLVDEELTQAHIRRPDLVIGSWAVPTILEHGTATQIEKFVMPTLRGEITWCQLFSEPGAGSDLAALCTKALRVQGGWVLSGQKVWTSLAREANWAICLARTNSKAVKHKGITYFLVDMDSPGITIRPLREITGDAVFNEVFLDGVFVPDAMVIGEVDGGWRLARTTLANERVAMGSDGALGGVMEELIVGLADQQLSEADRQSLGVLISQAQVGTLLELRTALRALQRQDPGAASSVRKLIGVRHRQAVAEFAMERLGDTALADCREVKQFLLTRCLSIAGGTTEILLTVAAEQLLGLPRAT
ncbi:MAG: acyl-CoA dehydrogenase family protein [Mycobacteriaceae bacterium]